MLVHGFWVTPRSWEHWVAFTQILLDHGLGAAGVALNSAPTEGVRVVPLSQVKATFPVLKSPANRHKVVPLSFEQWQYAFTNNDGRAPLLFVSGSEDHIMPPAIQKSNAEHYTSDTVTERIEYDGYAHLLPAQKGWEQIADDVLEWAVRHARTA